MSDLHRRKQPSPNISTDAGISISINPAKLNAHFSIRDNLDPDTNVNEVSDPHRRKQYSLNISTDEGITISINPLFSNAIDIPIERYHSSSYHPNTFEIFQYRKLSVY
jgi:hypothetical protein